MIESSVLKEIVLSQKEHFKKDFGIKRELKFKPLKRFATIITGLRRSGKSTYIRQLLKNKKINYFNFEDIRVIDFDLKDFMKLEKVFEDINGKEKVYFFDEIQNIDSWEVYIRQLLDLGKDVYITGSNAKMLSRKLGTRLTGRYLRKTIFPFNFEEFCKAKKREVSLSSFKKYLTIGGMPEYVLQDDIEILQLFLDDLIYRDILSRSNIGDAKLVKSIVTYLLSNSGKLTSQSKLKNIFEVNSVSTISLILNALEDSYFIFRVPKYDHSIKKQIRNPIKIYSIDNAFISKVSFQVSPNFGRLLENIVFIELKRRNEEVYYHKDKYECDFLIKKGIHITEAIQVCYKLDEDNRQREYSGLLEGMKANNIEQGYILTMNEEDKIIIDGKKIIIKPVWKWLG